MNQILEEQTNTKDIESIELSKLIELIELSNYFNIDYKKEFVLVSRKEMLSLDDMSTLLRKTYVKTSDQTNRILGDEERKHSQLIQEKQATLNLAIENGYSEVITNLISTSAPKLMTILLDKIQDRTLIDAEIEAIEDALTIKLVRLQNSGDKERNFNIMETTELIRKLFFTKTSSNDGSEVWKEREINLQNKLINFFVPSQNGENSGRVCQLIHHILHYGWRQDVVDVIVANTVNTFENGEFSRDKAIKKLVISDTHRRLIGINDLTENNIKEISDLNSDLKNDNTARHNLLDRIAWLATQDYTVFPIAFVSDINTLKALYTETNASTMNNLILEEASNLAAKDFDQMTNEDSANLMLRVVLSNADFTSELVERIFSILSFENMGSALQREVFVGLQKSIESADSSQYDSKLFEILQKMPGNDLTKTVKVESNDDFTPESYEFRYPKIVKLINDQLDKIRNESSDKSIRSESMSYRILKPGDMNHNHNTNYDVLVHHSIEFILNNAINTATKNTDQSIEA